MIHLKLGANCHGQKVFGPHDLTINLQISGKKIIKSIQERLLSLKDRLRDQVKEMHPSIIPPDHIL